MRLCRTLFLLALIGVLAGCGFHLRGTPGTTGARMPYRALHIALPESNEINVWMRRYIRAGGDTEVVDTPQEADAVLQQVSDARTKTILSVNAQGRVREYRLQQAYKFQLVTPQGRLLMKPTEINLTRDISYDDSAILAKDIEENLLWRDMSRDLVNQIIRRISLTKPLTGEEDD